MMPPFVPLALAFVVGALLSSCLSVGWAVPCSIGLGAAGISWWQRRHPRVALVALFVLWVCVGMLRALSELPHPPGHVSSMVGAEPAPVIVHGVVVNDPLELFNPNEPERQVCVVRVLHLRSAEGWRVVRGLLRARLRDSRIMLGYGDEVLLEGRASSVPPPGNPGQFDWRAALARQQIYGLLSVEPYHGVVRLTSGHGHGWFRAMFALRQRLEGRLRTQFDESHSGLLRSLLLGQRVSLDEGLKRAFVETGTMHLLVISGFNVGLIAAILELLLRLLGFPLRLRLVVSGLCLFGYCILTGMQAPVTRATIMAWVVLGALWLDRLINWPNALATAALVILWVNPAQLFDPGFQLSVGAVASLLVFTAPFQAFLAPHLRIRPAWLHRYVTLSLASTLAVWVGLWPLLAWYFHLVSLVSILANLVLVPLVSLLVSSGTPLLLLGAIITSVLHWTGGGLILLVDLIVACVRGCQQIPFGFWPLGHLAWWVVGGYYALIVLSLLRSRLRRGVGWVIACWLVGLNLWLWVRIGTHWLSSRWLEVTILDVGHGDSIVIRTPNHQTILVDTGTQEAGRYAVVPFLRFRGFHTLDALVLTHPDEDHLGGALPVLQELRVKCVLTNGAQPLTPTGRQVLALIEAKHLRQERVAAGMRMTGGADVDMLVLHPPPQFVPGTRPSSNDNSVVIKLTKGQASLLLCGDLEERGVPWIMNWSGVLRSSVLKVPHHGSALGSWERSFLAQIHPAWAVISVGKRRGLPSAQILQDLTDLGARIVMTRREGAVTIRTDGQRLLVHTFRDGHAF